MTEALSNGDPRWTDETPVYTIEHSGQPDDEPWGVLFDGELVETFPTEEEAREWVADNGGRVQP